MYKYKNNQPTVWFHKDKAKSNQNCLYCGTYIGVGAAVESNREHLIARSFVPKGYYSPTDFNFIFRSCVSCNNKKSNIERHVSTVTLFNSDSRELDEDMNQNALRKAKHDYHPDTKGKLVIDSDGEIESRLISNKLSVKAKLIYPPQLKEEFVCELAFRHLQGVMMLLAVDNPLMKGNIRPVCHKHSHVLGIYPKNDWGNPDFEYFLSCRNSWLEPCKIDVAKGHFKMKLYLSKGDEPLWLWVSEWNRSYRVMGMLCSLELLDVVMRNAPESEFDSWVGGANNDETRLVKLTPLLGDDLIFT
ncbi:hypothetical protein [Pseudoalteromonas sp. Z9A4]|uniref:hypothetical protein n=1 Tax=Pseudoalteromonas sp. Z9A4 TaxID=2686353 RepID=UPI00140CC54C|nr:hypothetical protein [Pseudoalteromonas sp. Z9A4]